MNSISKSLFLIILLLTARISTASLEASSAGTAQCVVFGAKVAAVWQTQTDTGSTGIQGGVGTFLLPGGLTITELEIPGTTQNFAPSIILNETTGVCLAIWQYLDASNNMQVAASVLPTLSGTWTTTTTLSTTSGETAGFNDQIASIDADGNILVTWTSTDGTIFRVRGATYTILSGLWSSPFDISQN